MDWQTFQTPDFPVLWCSIPRDDRPAPLQIRSFTSDSYKSIKERERKTSCRRKGIAHERRSGAQHTEDWHASIRAEAISEITRTASGAQDVVLASTTHGSHNDRLAIENSGKGQLNDEVKYEVTSDAARSINLLGQPSVDGFGCVSLPRMSAFSSDTRTDREVLLGSQHPGDSSHDRGPDSFASLLHDVPLLTGNGDHLGGSAQEREIGTRNDTDIAIKSSSYCGPTDISFVGCPSALCEQCNDKHGNRSSESESLELDGEHVAAAAAVLNCFSNQRAAKLPSVNVLAAGHSRGIDRAQQALELKRTITYDSVVGPAGTNAAFPLQRNRPDDFNGIAARPRPQHSAASDCAQLNWFPELECDQLSNYSRLDDDLFVCSFPEADEEGRPYPAGLDGRSSLNDQFTTVTDAVSGGSPVQCATDTSLAERRSSDQDANDKLSCTPEAMIPSMGRPLLTDHWTDDDDNLLRHLCSVAELPWTDVARYFRHADQEALKGRLKEIQASSAPMGVDSPRLRTSRSRKRRLSKQLHPARSGPPITTPRHRGISGKARSKSRPSAGRRQGSETAAKVRLTSTAPLDGCVRVSRSGRPLLPPFKHWAGEGYVWREGEVAEVLRTSEHRI